MKVYRVQWVIDGKLGQIAISGLWEVDAVSVSYAAAKVKVQVGEEYGVDIDKVRIQSISTEKASQSSWQ